MRKESQVLPSHGVTGHLSSLYLVYCLSVNLLEQQYLSSGFLSASLSPPSFSSFSTWESHRVTNAPTIACRNGLSLMSAGIIQLLSQRSFNVYPHCLSTKLCQEKQVPFSNLCLAKQEMRIAKGKRHSLFQWPSSGMHHLGFCFQKWNYVWFFFWAKKGSR